MDKEMTPILMHANPNAYAHAHRHPPTPTPTPTPTTTHARVTAAGKCIVEHVHIHSVHIDCTFYTQQHRDNIHGQHAQTMGVQVKVRGEAYPARL